MDPQIISAWYFHLPNYVLAAIIWTLIGRFGLSLFVPPDWDNYIWRAFVALTEWVCRLIALITPRLVPPGLLPLIAAFWLFGARSGLALLLLPATTPAVG